MPARPASSGSAGRTAAAFFIGGAVTTAVSFVITVIVDEAISRNLSEISSRSGELTLDVVGFVSSVIVGVAMALAFLVAKARGGVTVVLAAAGAFLADRVATVFFDTLYAPMRYHYSLTQGLRFSVEAYGHYSLVTWLTIFVVPLAAGGLTAVWAFRSPRTFPPPPPGWQPPGPGPMQHPATPHTPPGPIPPTPYGHQFPGGSHQMPGGSHQAPGGGHQMPGSG